MSKGQAEDFALACPSCGGGLWQNGATLVCEKRHSFDLGREGYVNLAVGRHPGDTKPMLLARRAFLDAGHYRPLSLAVNAWVVGHLSRRASDVPERQERLRVLDSGCGEGYYTRQLANHMASSAPAISLQTDLFGLDISRDGIRLAAKRSAGYPSIFFITANLRAGLPFRAGSIEVLLNIFAPRYPAEFARVLLSGGLLLIVIPRPDHLVELRTRLPLLAIEEQKRERVITQFAGAFSLFETLDLSYQLQLRAEEVNQLLTMMPTRRQDHQVAYSSRVAEPVCVTASFTLLALMRS